MKNNRTKSIDRYFTHHTYTRTSALQILFVNGVPALMQTYWKNSIDLHYKTKVFGYTYAFDVIGPNLNETQQDWLVGYVDKYVYDGGGDHWIRYKKMAPFVCLKKATCFDHKSMKHLSSEAYNRKYGRRSKG